MPDRKKTGANLGLLSADNPASGKPYTYSQLIDILRSTKYSQAKDPDIYRLILASEREELDPSGDEIYLMPLGGVVHIGVHYLVFLRRVLASGCLTGLSITIHGEGEAKSAIVILRREGWEEPFIWEVSLREAKGRKRGPWDEMPEFMLKKTALRQALRLAFADHLHTLAYDAEELDANPPKNDPAIPTDIGG